MFNRVGGVLLIWDNDGMRPSSSTCATGWEEHVVAAERGCYLPPAASLCKLCCSFALLQHIASALMRRLTGLEMDQLKDWDW